MHPNLQAMERLLVTVPGPISKSTPAGKMENVFLILLSGFDDFAMKRLQFHPLGATFGASEAPGRGDAFYDGFRADFEIDPS